MYFSYTSTSIGHSRMNYNTNFSLPMGGLGGLKALNILSKKERGLGFCKDSSDSTVRELTGFQGLRTIETKEVKDTRIEEKVSKRC